MTQSLTSYIRLLAYKYRIYFLALTMIAIIASLFGVAVNYKIKEIIDAIEANPRGEVVGLLALLIFYKGMFHGMYFIGRLFDIKYKPKMLAEIVTDAYTKTVGHSLHWFDSHLSGEIASKITGLEEGITTVISDVYLSIGNLATILIAIIFLLYVNTLAAGVVVAFIIIWFPVLAVLLRKQLQLQEQYVKSQQVAVGIINDSIANIFGIKIIGNVWTELKLKLTPAIARWRDWDKKNRQYDAYYVDLIDAVLVTILGAAEILLLAYLYKHGKISAGDFAFIAMVSLTIKQELDNLLFRILSSINPKIAAIKSSYEFINMASDVVDVPGAVELPRIKGEIRYDHVEFGYGSGSNVFNGLSIHIKPGERIGIVGTSGAGKTTFIKCLLRYFDVRSGSILVDGFDISQVTQESLRANISVIPQDISMFHRTILENLQLAKHDATLEEIIEACKKARIHDDIERMSHGYDSIVGERGVKVSGGQRQRIAIARAMLKNAPILILDEATSALDTPTETLIQASINEILDTTNATTIVIAHRLSTLLHMDRILVFEHGKIAAGGTHKELLAHGGIYKALWDAQVGGFLPDIGEEK